jgi:hypothetical protein
MRQATSDVNPESPAIKTLADALEQRFPNVVLFTTNNESPGTRHTSGIAIDIMLDVTNSDSRGRAHSIIKSLIDLSNAMLWSDIIYSVYDGKNISYFHIPARGGFGGPKGMLQRNPYTADTKHGDHIHVDWVDFSMKNEGNEYLRIPYKWSAAAQKSDFSAALSAALTTIP